MTDEAEAKQKGQGKVKEGNFKMISRLFKELGKFFHGGRHTVDTVQRNLMCRYFSVDELHDTHFG